MGLYYKKNKKSEVPNVFSFSLHQGLSIDFLAQLNLYKKNKFPPPLFGRSTILWIIRWLLHNLFACHPTLVFSPSTCCIKGFLLHFRHTDQCFDPLAIFSCVTFCSLRHYQTQKKEAVLFSKLT